MEDQWRKASGPPTTSSTRKKKTSRNSPARSRPSPSRYRNSPARRETEEKKKLSPKELEDGVEIRLRSKQYESAALWIKQSKYLSSKYQVSDVVRLTLDAKQYDVAGRLIRDMKLQANQLLLTLFVKELVKSGQFNLAIRYAQELIPDFGKTTQNASWTPQTLIQAMIRGKQYASALKYAQQFDLLDIFSPAELVPKQVEQGQLLEAFKNVQKFQLNEIIPVEKLILSMLKAKEWSNAINCINKSGETMQEAFPQDRIVRHMIECGDFVTALAHLRKYKLDSDTALLTTLIQEMIAQKEWYKAIKYAVKFNLVVLDQFSIDRLLRQAMEEGQCHVAWLYIKRLHVEDTYEDMLIQIEEQRKQLLLGFRAMLSAKYQKYHEISEIEKRKAVYGVDYCDMDPIETITRVEEVVVSEVEEIIVEEEEEETILLKKNSFDFNTFAQQVQETKSEVPVQPVDQVSAIPMEELNISSLVMQFHQPPQQQQQQPPLPSPLFVSHHPFPPSQNNEPNWFGRK